MTKRAPCSGPQGCPPPRASACLIRRRSSSISTRTARSTSSRPSRLTLMIRTGAPPASARTRLGTFLVVQRVDLVERRRGACGKLTAWASSSRWWSGSPRPRFQVPSTRCSNTAQFHAKEAVTDAAAHAAMDQTGNIRHHEFSVINPHYPGSGRW